MTSMLLPTIQLAADDRQFPKFNLVRLLSSVFEPTQGKRICILIDLPDPTGIKEFGFLENPKFSMSCSLRPYFATRSVILSCRSACSFSNAAIKACC